MVPPRCSWIFSFIIVGKCGFSNTFARASASTTNVLKQQQYKFYIYEDSHWPSIAAASLHKRDPNELLDNQLNHGAGPTVNAKKGMYHTDQYQLFSMIYYRALKDYRRTLNPAEATSFIIPYDLASDCAYYKKCSKSAGVCYDFRKCPLAPKVEAMLLESPWFRRNQGKDHLLVVGMNYAMDHYIGKPKCKSLLSGVCRNCTKFAIDDYSYMYATDAGILSRGDHWHAIPFPGDFHWTKDVQAPLPWENTDRPILVSYIGSTKSFYGPARRLRSSIAHYCEKHPSPDCVHQTYGLNGTRFSFKVDGHNPLELSAQSTFCFQPIGDLMTRKGLFDSLFHGCIPVVFDDLTASVMYTWHWPEAFWREIVVLIDFHPVAHRYRDPIEYLKKMMTDQPETVRRKQALIRGRVFELQYSLDGLHEVYQFQSALPYTTLSQAEHPAVEGGIDNSAAASGGKGGEGAFEQREKVSREIEYITFNETGMAQLVKLHNGSGTSWPRVSTVTHSSTSALTSVQQSRRELGSIEIASRDEEGGGGGASGDGDNKATGAESDNNFMRDAYDVCMDLMLGWHSGELEDVRYATVPECWDGYLNKTANRCMPGAEPKLRSRQLSMLLSARARVYSGYERAPQVHLEMLSSAFE